MLPLPLADNRTAVRLERTLANEDEEDKRDDNCLGTTVTVVEMEREESRLSTI